MDCCNNKPSAMQRIKSILENKKHEMRKELLPVRKVALIGNPNVGKSVIFNNLTGAYVTVSNYPGTTVEISRGYYLCDDVKIEVIDTPGMYSMLSITEEERVARKLLMREKPELVLHIIDAKNIGRMLPLTLQLIEAGYRVMLVLNIMDEAKSLGMNINCKKLEKHLGIKVIEASAALNEGMDLIKKCVKEQIVDAA